MTVDTTKMSVEEIRNYLVNLGMSQEEVNSIKGKSALAETLKSKTQVEECPFDTLEEEIATPSPDKEKEVTEKLADKPRYGSKEWCDHVMSQFHADELVEGHPNISGLRRLTRELIGHIVSSKPTSVNMSGDRAFCIYEVVITKGYNSFETMTFGGAADSCVQNTDDVYGMYPVAMAEVRAESRALKRALGIKEASAEEVSKENAPKFLQELLKGKDTNAEWEGNELITDVQIKTIQTQCDRLGIDVNKLIALSPKGYKSINELSKESAVTVIGMINGYQNKPETIPTGIKK